MNVVIRLGHRVSSDHDFAARLRGIAWKSEICDKGGLGARHDLGKGRLAVAYVLQFGIIDIVDLKLDPLFLLKIVVDREGLGEVGIKIV